MRRTLIVASAEFGTLVRSKAFVITLLLMPVIMVGSGLLARASRGATDTTPRRFAYIDRSGVVGPVLEAAAAARNGASPGRAVADFVPVAVPPDGRPPDALRLELSDRVRRKELFAFVEIPADVADPSAAAGVRYYSDHPSYGELPQWLRLTIGQAVLAERFRSVSVDPALVTRLTKPTAISSLGLFERDTTGEVRPGREVDPFRAIGVPAVMMGLMYIVVMASAPQLLNSVIEEKMSRISEVLIGSVSAFQLMMGKLIACTGVSLLLASIYLTGGLAMGHSYGYGGAVTPAMVGWFLLFLLMAVLLFGSIFIAIGAACTDLKDSQNMMTPALIFLMVPLFTWAAILRAPDSTLAVALSLVPTAAPFLMLLRIALHPGPPLWQILLSVAIMAATTVLCVWAAGRIFRTGILMQGKSATMGEMVRWVRQS